jgi:Tfp pilus assembly protein PilO
MIGQHDLLGQLQEHAVKAAVEAVEFIAAVSRADLSAGLAFEILRWLEPQAQATAMHDGCVPISYLKCLRGRFHDVSYFFEHSVALDFSVSVVDSTMVKKFARSFWHTRCDSAMRRHYSHFSCPPAMPRRE